MGRSDDLDEVEATERYPNYVLWDYGIPTWLRPR